MSAAYLDAAVFVHALGRDDDLREACRSVLAMVRAETIVAQSSVLTVEEVVHVRSRRLGDRARAVREGRDVASMVGAPAIISTGADFDALGDAQRIDPRDARALAQLVG